MLTIKDLTASKELDSKEMAGVAGGSHLAEIFPFINLDFLSPDNNLQTDNDIVNQALVQNISADTIGVTGSAAPTVYVFGANVADTGANATQS